MPLCLVEVLLFVVCWLHWLSSHKTQFLRQRICLQKRPQVRLEASMSLLQWYVVNAANMPCKVICDWLITQSYVVLVRTSSGSCFVCS